MDSEMCLITVNDYLINKVKFKMPMKALQVILIDRGLEDGIDYTSCSKDAVRLAYADMLKWFVIGASKVNNTTETDNGWSHAGGGYELTSDDISELKAEANAIYEELEPSSKFKKKATFRINSYGVKRANTDRYGNPLPHIIG